MDLKDATDDVIDTSDDEERELLEAQKPGYHQRAWGHRPRADCMERVDMEVDTEGVPDGSGKPSFAQLPPRTPSHNRILPASDLDPSPIMSTLRISPRPPSSTSPITTPIDLIFNSDSVSRSTSHAPASSTPFSSPLGALQAVPQNMKMRITEHFDMNADLNTSQDPISLLPALVSKRRAVQHAPVMISDRSHGENHVQDIVTSPAPSASSTLNTTPSLTHSGFGNKSPDFLQRSSPPLVFPQSPDPDPHSSPVHYNLGGTSQGSNPFQTPNDAKTAISTISANYACDTNHDTDENHEPDMSPSPGTHYSLDFVLTDDLHDSLPRLPLQGVPQSPGPNTISSPLLFAPPRLPGPGDTGRADRIFRSMSPLTPPPPTQPLIRRTPSTPSPSAAPAQPSLQPIIPPDSDPPRRAYSLRHRSAMQLNPFAYEKKMYKRQLRGMPEAIVKDPTAVGRGLRERYRDDGDNKGAGEGEDWENAEGEAEGDEDEEWRRSEQRREKQREREREKQTADVRMRELGLVFPSEEEEEVLREVGGSENGGGDPEKRGKKRRKVIKVRKFPMAVGPEEPEASSSRRHSTPPTKPRPRPRPAFRGQSHTPHPSAPAPSGSAFARPMDRDFSFGHDFDAGADDWPRDKGPRIDHVDGRRSSPILVDDDESQPRMGRLRRGRSSGNDSDVQILDDDPDPHNNSDRGDQNHASGSEVRNSDLGKSSSDEVELMERDRKRLKALRRMMPAALARKLLADEQEKAKQKTKEQARQLEESDEEEEVVPLQPGRGRKRIVSPSSRDPKRYEIKGDTESESESQSDAGAGVTDREIIVVDDDDASEEDAERALEESDDGVDDGDIQTWLDPDRASSAPPSAHVPRVRRPDYERDRPQGGDLIDRMLQRTRRVGPRDSKPRNKHKSKLRRPQNPALDIVTRDAKRHGAGGGRQTKLRFPKANGGREHSADRRPRTSGSGGRARSPSAGHYQEHHVEARLDETRKKSKKKRRAPVQTRLLIVHPNGQKVISGRGRQFINIDDDDYAFHEALVPVGPDATPHARPRTKDKTKVRPKHAREFFNKFRIGVGAEPDAFDADVIGGQRYSHVTLDFDIPFLPSGMAFGPESYVGKGRLYHLIAVLKGDVETPRPTSVVFFGQDISLDMSIPEISPILATAFDKLYDASVAALDVAEATVTAKVVEATMHSLCQMISFRALYTDDDDDGLLAAAVLEQTVHLVGRISDRLEALSADGHSLDHRSFALYWFAMELHLRLAHARQKRNERMENASCLTTCDAEHYMVLLLCRLLEYGLDRTVRPFQELEEPLDLASPDIRTLELWVCAFHVTPLLQTPLSCPTTPPPPPFWRVVQASMEAQSNRPDSQLDASERIWRALFTLCAISQFSVHGLTTSAVRLEPHWPIVSQALRCIRLSADENLDNSKPASTLQKRDAYVRLVTSRCFLLCVRWNWRLNDADGVFRDLFAIFRSRNFANLLGEPSDFPTFIRDQDESLFHVHKKGDTAFGLFLKLIVRAAKDFLDAEDTRPVRSVKLSRLLSLAVPVGSTSFTKASPPLGRDLSMLYNRYSAIIVAIYVDSSASNIRARLQQARRYITFKDADCNSRAASIRAMMNIAILLRHLDKPLDDVLSWASELTNDLVDNHDAVTQSSGQQQLPNGFSKAEKDQLLLSVQLLLGSLRLVIQTPAMTPFPIRPAKYPYLGFLQGAWITRVFRNSSLAHDHRTGLEIRKFMQSFLAARMLVIPTPPLPKLPADQQEIQESQDEYDDGGLDLDDPGLLEFLNKLEGPPDENSVADEKASEAMDTIARAIYALVIRHFRCNAFDRRQPGSFHYEGDQWLECWLGCASVAVRHKRRDWAFFFDLGRDAIDYIHDSFWRTRMRLRHMLTVMQLDPAVYKSHGIQIVEVWFQTIVSPDITIEHEFTARLFSIDGLRHLLFRNMPCAPHPDTELFAFELLEFEQLRSSLIEVTLRNAAEGLENAETVAETARYIPILDTMLSTLRKWFESMDLHGTRRSKYLELSRCIITEVTKHQSLMQEPSVRNTVDWAELALIRE